MYFVLERTKKTLEALYRQFMFYPVEINTFRMKEGNYLNLQEVDRSGLEWSEYTSGDMWGGRDVHAWFRTTVSIPEELDGRIAVLKVNTGSKGWDTTNPQFILQVNGKILQGIDRNHTEVILEHNAKAGTNYQIDLHAYSGMEEKKSDLSMSVFALNDRVYRLFFDISVPLQIAECLPEEDKNRIDIQNILSSTINLIDLRKPGSTLFQESIEAALKLIETEFYEKMCDHDEIIATCVGHTHIDVAWLWTLAQTREKVTRSFSTVLNLMEEYPDYIFMSSQPQLYKFLKEDHPELYEKVKERVEEGRWEPEGGMWVEADTNLSSGESLVRQFLFGTRFFEKEFGVKNEVLWLPDVFGYSAALPQIMKKSDIKYFMTTKISWNQFNKLPYDTFMWRGIDGTEVLTHFISTRDYEANPSSHGTTYNGYLRPSQVMGAWQRYQQKNINNDVLICFGHGDGGGGATIDMLENAKRLAKGLPGNPKVKMGKSKDYFRKLEQTVGNNKYLPKWVGELYLEYHRGTYTSMGKNKRNNRKSELLYQDIETASSFHKLLGGTYNQEKINNAWETILLNQFHDIIPGSSILEVYEVSGKQYAKILSEGKEMMKEALSAITDHISIKERSLVIFNTLSYHRSDVTIVNLNEFADVAKGADGLEITDTEGNLVLYQLLQEEDDLKLLLYVENVPAKGYKALTIKSGLAPKPKDAVRVTKDCMENRFFCLQLDDKGTISSLMDKVNHRQVLMSAERGNKLLAFEDRPMNWDNWDIDIYYQEKMWEVDDVVSVTVLEQGPVRGAVRITKSFLDSTIVQDMYIYRDIPRIDFKTHIDWKEDQVLLKASFPVDVHSDKATYDIQYGNVERPTHWNTSWDTAKFEVCAHKWADLSEGDYGVSLMNDCKYGYDIRDGHMRLTLLKSGMYPNPKADRGEHDFTYSLYPHKGDWRIGGTVQMAYNLNVPLYAAMSEKKEGSLPSAMSLVELDCDNVILETVKKAEDSDDIIIRMYECYNQRSKVTCTFFRDIQKVVECNLMEKPLSQYPSHHNQFSFEIKPYEIKTFLLQI
ncbi:MAG: alpha-mannosidase [Lachnospiraceae bacterium]|nr:alpha-mannosidase [Lachnospiraceae bacterium]